MHLHIHARARIGEYHTGTRVNSRKMAPSNPLVPSDREADGVFSQLTYHFRCPIRGDIASWTTIVQRYREKQWKTRWTEITAEKR